MPQIVLFQPQIPPNTGSIARTCAATGTELHLVEPLGFQIDDRQLKRAGLDYWPLVSLQRHADWSAFADQRVRSGGRLIALSSHASQPYTSWQFELDDWLLFGRETDGLPKDVLASADAALKARRPLDMTLHVTRLEAAFHLQCPTIWAEIAHTAKEYLND